jgi:hypothetical protein
VPGPAGAAAVPPESDTSTRTASGPCSIATRTRTGSAVGMHLPDAFVAVHGPLLLSLPALGALVIAVGGALLPAGWAARTDTARPLRTE